VNAIYIYKPKSETGEERSRAHAVLPVPAPLPCLAVGKGADTYIVQGYKWGVDNKDIQSDQPQGFTTSMGEKRKLLLSPRYKGFFLVPESGLWNYSFIGPAFDGVVKKPVHVKLDTPAPFYSDTHRPLHFQNFAQLEDIWVDRNDNFA